MKTISTLLAVCGGLTACTPSSTDLLRVNQVGYYPHQEKVAVVNNGTVEKFTVVETTTGKEVFSGQPSYQAASTWSDKQRSVLDFSAITQPGLYQLHVNGETIDFQIKDDALADLAKAALKSFYYQRTAMPIEEAFAGKWHRPAGHMDQQVRIHANAASHERPEGTLIASSKGWYDAGDYNKYIVNSAFSIGLMHASYRLFPHYYEQQNVQIPESNNQTPDFLDEMHYNLSWMLTMQDPNDGGVYHKLTTPSFEGFVKPTECQQPRYVVAKSVTAALDFAASMAQASQLFAAYEKDYPGFSQQALQAAERAYAWASAHPEALYDQDALNQQYKPAVTTGSYGDRQASDEFFWAASELYLLTGKKEYRTDVQKYFPKAYQTPSWGNTTALGFFAWLQPNLSLNEADTEWKNQLKDLLLSYSDQLIKTADQTPFHAPYGNSPKDFFWGCLAERCANQGMSLVYSYMLTKQPAYLINAYRNMDYLLGRNATGYCYVTGFGSKSPQFPHHRLSASDDIAEPLPGFLVGGPNPGQQDHVTYPSNLPDEAYADVEESYASNEIAINWSAALVALTSSLDALQNNLK